MPSRGFSGSSGSQSENKWSEKVDKYLYFAWEQSGGDINCALGISPKSEEWDWRH